MDPYSTQLMERSSLEAIYSERFETIDGNESHFKMYIPMSSLADCNTIFEIEYSENYPEEPLKQFDVTFEGKIPQIIKNSILDTITVSKEQLEQAGQPYLFELASLVNEAAISDGFTQDYYKKVEDESEIVAKQIKTNKNRDAIEGLDARNEVNEDEFNPGALPGPMVTKKSFAEWWKQFKQKNKIKDENDKKKDLEAAVRDGIKQKMTGLDMWTLKIQQNCVADYD